jgi:hypothetical protein
MSINIQVRDADGRRWLRAALGFSAAPVPYVQGNKPYLYYAYEADLSAEECKKLGEYMTEHGMQFRLPDAGESVELKTPYGMPWGDVWNENLADD